MSSPAEKLQTNKQMDKKTNHKEGTLYNLHFLDLKDKIRKGKQTCEG